MGRGTALKEQGGVWAWAYFAVCLWYFVNLAFGSFITYYFFAPQTEEFLHGLCLFLFYMGYIALVWAGAHLLWKRSISMQIGGQVLGVLLGFLAVSWINFELSIYFDNRTADSFSLYLIESHSGTKVSGKMDAFRIYNEYVALLFIAYAIRYAQSLKKREREKALLEIDNKEMELSLLKSQINPHFLFNTLNSISMLVGVSKELARKVISQLSDILRYALESGKHQTVPLSDELQFIDSFLAIQLVRFDNSFEFVKEIDQALLNMPIPPMVLQPLIENAVKYGVGQLEGKGFIKLLITQKQKRIYIEVSDNGPGKNAQTIQGHTSTGIGLQNTNKRLQNLYGTSAQLQIEASENGFKVGFYIPKTEAV